MLEWLRRIRDRGLDGAVPETVRQEREENNIPIFSNLALFRELSDSFTDINDAILDLCYNFSVSDILERERERLESNRISEEMYHRNLRRFLNERNRQVDGYGTTINNFRINHNATNITNTTINVNLDDIEFTFADSFVLKYEKSPYKKTEADKFVETWMGHEV